MTKGKSQIGGFHVTSSPPCCKRSLIGSFCLSTSICSFHHCYWCLLRLDENHLYEFNRLIKPHSRGRFICSRCISPLEFSILLSFSFKTIANSNRQIRRPCADSVNKFVRLISLIDTYLAFPFFHFSMTTFLQ